MIGAIFVPEGVFVIAFTQYWEAREVCKMLPHDRKQAGGGQDKPEEPSGVVKI